MRMSDWSSDVCSFDLVPRPLDSLAFRAAFDLRLAVSRHGGELRLKKIPIAVNDAPLRITGTVGSSLYKSARAAGVPARLVAEYIKALSFGIDFQRDVGARSEEHTSELQSLMRISYAVFCLKKKKKKQL